MPVLAQGQFRGCPCKPDEGEAQPEGVDIGIDIPEKFTFNDP